MTKQTVSEGVKVILSAQNRLADTPEFRMQRIEAALQWIAVHLDQVTKLNDEGRDDV